MESDFEKYLNSIGIVSATLLKRIDDILKDCSKITNEDLVDLFVDEYINEDGIRIYTDITFFAKNDDHIGVKNFQSENEYFMVNYGKKIDFIKIIKKDYNFKNSNENSRLTIEVTGKGEWLGMYKAARKNCDHLLKIYNKYLLPNLNR